MAVLHVPPSSSNASKGVIIIKKTVYVPTTVCPCEYTFDPVCGSDGVTYTNECLLACINDELRTRGLTPIVKMNDHSQCANCTCLDIDVPVCTMDGVTYPNECELYCENRRQILQKKPITYLAYRSSCIGPACSYCPITAAPVCGTDNVLYRNQCVLGCANTNSISGGFPQGISLKNYGACLDGCICPKKLEPVCGSDGNIYDNLCYLECQNRKQTYSKHPNIAVANRNICANCQCPSDIDPVCGSDGLLEPRTFQNTCVLDCIAKRSNNPYLKVISKGPCPKCFCTGVTSLVCGTNQKTYRNECELRCANDNVPKGGNPISIFYGGACQEVFCDCSLCSNEYVPLCGSDGRTYWNVCWLNCSNGCRKRDGVAQITINREGSCSKFD